MGYCDKKSLTVKASPPADEILDSLTTTILLVELDGTVHYVNGAAEAVLATSAERVRGRRAHDLLGIGAPLQVALAATEENRSTTLRELTLKQFLGGQSLVVDCTVSPFGWDGAEKLALIELIRVDQLSRFTAEARSQERHAVTTMLTDRLAHEIKNPLGGLRGAAQLLDRELSDRGSKEYTRIIIHEADRLSALVDRMMGSFTAPKKTWFNLHAVLEHVRRLTLADVQEGLTISRDYDPSLPEIMGDRELLVQAVLNIVRNAVQAMDGRGEIGLLTRIRRQFTLGNRCHRQVLEALISDNGPGIPADIRKNIFFPMVSGRTGGAGLGLSIAQDILSRHGGAIECVSQPGDTKFFLYLPVVELA